MFTLGLGGGKSSIFYSGERGVLEVYVLSLAGAAWVSW
jgi:hypothetical protein